MRDKKLSKMSKEDLLSDIDYFSDIVEELWESLKEDNEDTPPFELAIKQLRFCNANQCISKIMEELNIREQIQWNQSQPTQPK